jgi:hypothetical protein
MWETEGDESSIKKIDAEADVLFKDHGCRNR